MTDEEKQLEEKKLMEECLQQSHSKQPIGPRSFVLGIPKTIIHAGSKELFKLYPQTPFKPNRIIFPNSVLDSASFALWDLKICGKSQLSHVIPCSVFSQDAFGIMLQFETCPVGGLIELEIVREDALAVCFQINDDWDINDINPKELPIELRSLHPKASGHKASLLDRMYDGSFEIPEFVDVRYSDRYWRSELEGEIVPYELLQKCKLLDPMWFTGALMGTT
jgi:hypothetical protein